MAEIFKFDVSFDDHKKGAQLFTSQEIECIQKKAFEEGHQKGKEESQESIEAAIHSSLQSIQKDLKDLSQNILTTQNQVTAEMIEFLKLFIEKCMPVVYQETIILEMRQEVEQLIKESYQKGTFILKVHPDILEKRQEDIRKIIETPCETADAKKFQIMGDKNLTLADFEIYWEQGHLVKNSTQIMDKFLTLLTQGLKKMSVSSSQESRSDNNSAEVEQPHEGQ